MESNIITLTDLFPLIKLMCNFFACGVGTLIGGFIVGGFIIGFNDNF